MLRRTIICIALLAGVGGSCSQEKNTERTDQSGPILVRLNPERQFQAIDNFGASDAWSCQFVGKWPEPARSAIADLLFSTKMSAAGQPEGIGLSMWRFNIGAGSAQQGAASGIKDEWRRAESFMTPQGVYNWDLQQGQVWFLEAARKRGVEQFLAFTNSPPVHLTANQKAYATAGKPNLEEDKFGAFASFLTDVVKGLKEKTGITLNYISPANEPQWDWSDGGQEGTPFSNRDIAGIVRELDQAIVREQLPTRITITEAGQYDYIYSDSDKPDKGRQAEAFFKQGSPHFVGDLASVEKLIAAHSYFTTSPSSKALSVRQDLHREISSIPALRLWQSEYCILGDNDGEISGEGRDLGIGPALYLAKVMHTDLVVANVSAWHWWVAVSPYDYKDGLVYVDMSKIGGAYHPSKMLWAMGNYSRFIRPGARRIDAVSSQEKILVSAFINEGATELAAVLINSGAAEEEVELQLPGAPASQAMQYITSAELSLSPVPVSDVSKPLRLPAQSISTVIIKLKQH